MNVLNTISQIATHKFTVQGSVVIIEPNKGDSDQTLWATFKNVNPEVVHIIKNNKLYIYCV